MDVDSENYVLEKRTIFASGRSEKETQILNNSLIARTPTPNIYRNTDQDSEDKFLEWDLHIEWNNQAVTTLTDIQNRLELLTQDEKEKATLDLSLLSVFHMKAIKSLYGDKFEEVKTFLSQNPSIAVPIILKRLIQKKIEWDEQIYQEEIN